MNIPAPIADLVDDLEEFCDPDDEQPRQTAAERVQEILASDPEGLTQEQLREIIGYSEKTIRAALKQIGAKKLTRPGPNGKPLWVLPADEQLWPDDEGAAV